MQNLTVNKVFLIGNLVKKPKLRQTSKGVSVCTFHMITDRSWYVDDELRTSSTKHICVAWDRLAEICAEILNKSDKVYVEGRINTKKYTDGTGVQREQSEIVVNHMIKLDRNNNLENTEGSYGQEYY